MVFDFAAQPPELISAKIYSGPGTESLQAAAAAWDGLAGELQSTAANFQSVISGLVSGDWTGPSSEAAAAAAAPYVSWLSTTAGQAEQTAGQARAAASAYETALAATVPPAEIAANRTQLLSLLQTNILGQNNASIAALEAEYGQFWAQDVAAITGYDGSSQAATTGLGSFTEAPQTTNDSGQATQAAATPPQAPRRRRPSGNDHRADRGRRHQLPQPSHRVQRRLHQVLHQRARLHPRRVYARHDVDEHVLVDLGRRQPGHLDQRRQQLAKPWHWAVEELLHLPAVEPRDRLGIAERWPVVAGACCAPAWERGRHRRLWAARRRSASCRCRPAGPAPRRPSGLPRRRCRTALSPRRRLPQQISR